MLEGKPDLVAKYQNKPETNLHNPQLAAMLESIDEGVGRLVQSLRANGLLEDTLLIFTSDNGGEPAVASPSPLRGGKRQLYEGGVRVPFIAHYPRGVPADTTCDAPISTIDLFPTFTELASFDSNLALDGASLCPLFRGEDLAPRPLYWHFPRSHSNARGRSAGAVRQGEYKLIEFYDTGETELYNLAEDGGEAHDLAPMNPEIVRALTSQFSGWRASAGAVVT